jgi:hypothetical protein
MNESKKIDWKIQRLLIGNKTSKDTNINYEY